MVHPALATAAATALIGSAVAFELTVFKPWRQENWPDGFKAGIKRELDRTREDFREAAQEIGDFLNGRAPRSTMPNQRDNIDHSNRNARSSLRIQKNGSDSEDDYGDDAGRNKLDRSALSEADEFEMHEREVMRQRDRLREMFGDDNGTEMRNRKGNSVSGSGPSKTLFSEFSQPQSHSFEPESPHHEIGSSSPTLSSRSDAELDDAISNLGSTDPFSTRDQRPNRQDSFDHARSSTLFDVEDAEAQDPPALPPKPEAWRSNSTNNPDLDNSVWSLSDSRMGSSFQSAGNVTPRSNPSPIIPARSLSPEVHPDVSTPTLSATSWDQDQDLDLDLVSPPASLANGWEQESNFDFPNSSNASRDVSIDGDREGDNDLVVLSPFATSSNGNHSGGNNPFEEAWIVDEEEEEEDRKARDQLARSGSESQAQSQATIRQISHHNSESGESWADLDDMGRNIASVDTQGLKDSWSGSQGSLL